MSYRIQLQNFEGPLDLLLFLIRKSEVDIYDIPIAEITKQYLEYLGVLELLDLDNAGEFVLMAATLIRVKARMLLPRPQGEDEEEEDPREELVQRLLEYQRFKEVAENLSKFEKEQRQKFARADFSPEMEAFKDIEEPADLGEGISLYDLMSVFVDVLRRVPPATEHMVERIPVSVEEQSQFIRNILEQKQQILFRELLASFQERIVLIVTFVALLELVKTRELVLQQNQPFSEIWIQKK